MDNKLATLCNHIGSNNEAFLITSDINRLYITGFKSSDGAVLITKDMAYLMVDFRYGEAAQKKVKNATVIIYSSFANTITELCKKHDLEKVYLENEGISLAQANRIKFTLSKCNVKTGTDKTLDKIITNLRIIKSRAEVAKIKKAQEITELAYNEILNYIKPGVKENEIALELEFLMRKNGASAVSFDLITITGKKTSLPHGVPDNSVVNNGDFVTMDIGALYDGYHSDMTRTVAVGDVSHEQKEVYDIVLQAQLSALSVIKAGITGDYADKAARDVIDNAGYGEYFGHSTGHGVGLNIHEEPRLSPRVKTILSTGMIVTVEPGIYLPDKFGVRIEDMVYVTKNGCTNLTTAEKNLIIL
ncbi:MAG TPA: aminopeptidase P family protein [Clostridiales bacterium]|nr:aminopeptidase P family protein [Clostridiales bacterium]